MQRQYAYTAYYVEGDDGFVVAFAAELDVASQGRTIEEARESLRDAVAAVIAANERSVRATLEDRRVLLVEEQTTSRPA